MNTRLIRKADEARKLIVKETFEDLSKDLEVANFSPSAKKFLCYYETGQLNVLGTFNLFLKEVIKADLDGECIIDYNYKGGTHIELLIKGEQFCSSIEFKISKI